MKYAYVGRALVRRTESGCVRSKIVFTFKSVAARSLVDHVRIVKMCRNICGVCKYV